MIIDVIIKLLKQFPKIFCASSVFFSPKRMEANGAPPRPNKLVTAVIIVIIEVHKPIPAIANELLGNLPI